MSAWLRLSFALSLVALLALITACDSGFATSEPCQGNRDCASGRCGSFYEGGANVCLESCTDNADCPSGMACGTQADGARICVEACAAYVDGWVCVDDAPVACEVAGDAWTCYACGCDAGQFCDGDPGQCVPQHAVGESCRSAEECASNNCSVTGSISPDPPGECWNAAGAACTDETCGSCDPLPTGDVCAQHCNGNRDCGATESCVRLGGAVDRNFYCRSTCERLDDCARGWTCTGITDTNYATCFPPVTCTVGAADACANCTDLPGASFDICAQSCTPGLSACPFGWLCTGSASSVYRCLPPPP
jgi:hypothetical protein